MNKNNLIYLFGFLLFSGHLLASVHNPLKPFGLKNNLSNTADSATAKDSDEDLKERSYAIGLEGCSDQEHYGLRDSKQKLPFLEPSFTYTAKSGFYMDVSDQFLLMKKGGGFDVFGWNPGWNIDLTDNTTLNFNWQGYIFRSKSVNLIGSSEASGLSTYIEQDIGNLIGTFTAAYDIYKKPTNSKIPKTPNDFIFTSDLSYNFEYKWGVKTKQSFAVIPEVSLDFGTANFITNYENLKASDSTTSGLNPKNKSYTANTNSSFKLLDYSFTLSIEYDISKFEIEPQFTYCIPGYNTNPSQPNPKTAIVSLTLTYKIHSKK